MNRRSFLASGVGAVSLAGCIEVNYGPVADDRVAWARSLADPQLAHARDLAAADGVIAVCSGTTLFGVNQQGDVLWERFERATGVFGTDDGFLGLDRPDYHPRNACNERVLRRVSPDGERQWTRDAFHLTGIAVGGDAFYTVEERSEGVVLSAVSLATGDRRWTAPLDAPSEGPRLTRGQVITVGERIVAHDRTTGDRSWDAETFDTSWAPAVSDDRVYVPRDDSRVSRGKNPAAVHVFDAVTGVRRTAYHFGENRRLESPLVVRGDVGLAAVVGADDVQRLRAVDATTGDERWTATPKDALELGPSPRTAGAFTGGLFLATDFKYVLRAFDLADGTARWSFESEAHFPEVIASGGTAYLLAGGTLYALDPTS